MSTYYKMFLDGSPLTNDQIDGLIRDGWIEQDGRGGLRPTGKRLSR